MARNPSRAPAASCWPGCRDGSTFPIDLSVSEFHHGAGRLFTGIIRDVSERRAFQEKLLSIAEEEQRRIGQDLHDDIGQELTGLALKAETLAEIIDLGKAPDKAIARGIVADLDRTRKKLRLLARGLVPVEVDSKGLSTALLDLTERLGELNGVSCILECQGSALVEDGRVATQLYHIAQEAIANAIKHGQARTIKVLLETSKNVTKLEIKDDGKGLPRKLKRGQGTGLQIMAYRAGLLGGKLTLRQARPCGTMVTCVLARGTDHERDSTI